MAENKTTPTGASVEEYLASRATGSHELGKSRLYIKRLAVIDVGVLEQLIALSFAEVRWRYPT